MKLSRIGIWVALVLGFGLGVSQRPASAVAPVTLEQGWTDDSYYDADSAASSTHAVTGLGLSYSILVTGATAAYTVHETTKTFADGNVAITTSVVHETPLGGQAVNHKFRTTFAKNPKIVIHGLNTAATVQIWIEYLRSQQ